MSNSGTDFSDLFPADVQKWTVKEWAIVGGAVAFLFLIIIIIVMSTRSRKTKQEQQSLEQRKQNFNYVIDGDGQNEFKGRSSNYGVLPETAFKDNNYGVLPAGYPRVGNSYGVLPAGYPRAGGSVEQPYGNYGVLPEGYPRVNRSAVQPYGEIPKNSGSLAQRDSRLAQRKTMYGRLADDEMLPRESDMDLSE